MLRSLYTAALAPALAMSACGAPDLPRTDPTTPVVTAVFDPTTSAIPLPNDLAFLAPVNSVCSSGDKTSPTPVCAQADLLYGFSNYAPANAPAITGAFPNDQEVAITIDFTQANFGADHKITQTAPDLDFTTFTSSNFFVIRTSASGQSEMPLEPLTAADYVRSSDGTKATLTIHNQARQPWPPGSYALVMRGGPNGVQTKDKLPVNPSQVFDLLAQDVDLSDAKNLGLLKAQFGTTAAALEQGKQLNIVRLIYDGSAFPIADKKFPRQELAIATTFQIAPLVTNVVIDPATGQAPLPIDLLRDPGTGKLSALAACTLAGSSLDASGNCPNPAAAGFLALDGFSTTGAILGPTSDLIRAGSVTKDSLQLWDLSDKTNPVQVDPNTLILEPCEFTSAAQANGTCTSPDSALSPVIAIQPAGATAGDKMSVFRTAPLKDSTDYAVVMTTGILDKAGNALGSGSAARLLKFFNPIVAGGHSAVPGLDDATARQLEDMRGKLKPVLDKLTAAGTGRARVAIAYTFHTQTILSQATQLAALPYTTPAPTALPGPVTAETSAAAFTEFGVISAVPSSNIDEILETDITTFNLIDPATGAFNPDPTKAVPLSIHVLIATPKAANPNVPTCAGPLAAFGKCAPMMIFRHGLGRGRADMLLIADSFAAAGMTTVAIDAALHGDRSFCTSGTSGAASGCIGGAACTTQLPAGAQGDVHPPGTCGAAGFVKAPVTPGATGNTDGIPAVSGSLPYLLSANFFRTRDTFRQDVIDESQLVRAIAFAPSGAPPTGHSVFDHMVARGVIIDPATIYYTGQSLGAIHGTLDVATNPRISKAVLNVGGGTLVDIFTNSPAFAPAVNQLLAQVGIQRGTAQFLQFLVVAKTVLDPADPVNFAGHLTAKTLPNLLPPLGGAQDGHIAQAPKKILTQMANCDGVVPNPFGFVWASNIPTGPLVPALFMPNATGTFELFVTAPFDPATFGTCPGASAVNHGFLLDFANPSLTLNAQSDAAKFVMSNTLAPSVQHQ
jgi:hypothetical protein